VACFEQKTVACCVGVAGLNAQRATVGPEQAVSRPPQVMVVPGGGGQTVAALLAPRLPTYRMAPWVTLIFRLRSPARSTTIAVIILVMLPIGRALLLCRTGGRSSIPPTAWGSPGFEDSG